MSRVSRSPIIIPAGVDFNVSGHQISAKGSKGTLTLSLHPDVDMSESDGKLLFKSRIANGEAMAGTMRALVGNILKGVSEGFEKKLELVGVGYRAKSQGKVLTLSLGFSHPVNFPVPEGIEVQTPSLTEIVVKGIDKQQVGQVASEIRQFRPPEPYKAKGVRYWGEIIVRKSAKKQ